MDSNHGMTGSKPVALPLGDRPAVFCTTIVVALNNGAEEET